jgi:hypothetical protein
MHEIYDYFNVQSDNDLLILIVTSVFACFILVLLFPVLFKIVKELKTILSFRKPVIENVTAKHINVGNQEVYQIEWDVKNASTIHLPNLNISNGKWYHFFKTKKQKQLNLTFPSGKLTLMIVPIEKKIEVVFENIWGGTSVFINIDQIVKYNVVNEHQVNSRKIQNTFYLSFLNRIKKQLIQTSPIRVSQREKEVKNLKNQLKSISIETKKNIKEKVQNQINLNSELKIDIIKKELPLFLNINKTNELNINNSIEELAHLQNECTTFKQIRNDIYLNGN